MIMTRPMKKRPEIVPSADGLTKELTLKVFGVGGAGCNAVEHIAQSRFAGVQFAAVNTDIQSLLDLSVECVLPLGATRTRGLGAGGDPDVGRTAAEEDTEQLRQLCAGAEVVVIVTGLGGGTGTGVSPVLAPRLPSPRAPAPDSRPCLCWRAWRRKPGRWCWLSPRCRSSAKARAASARRKPAWNNSRKRPTRCCAC